MVDSLVKLIIALIFMSAWVVVFDVVFLLKRGNGSFLKNIFLLFARFFPKTLAASCVLVMDVFIFIFLISIILISVIYFFPPWESFCLKNAPIIMYGFCLVYLKYGLLGSLRGMLSGLDLRSALKKKFFKLHKEDGFYLCVFFDVLLIVVSNSKPGIDFIEFLCWVSALVITLVFQYQILHKYNPR